MEKVVQRFLKYVKYNTVSDPNSMTCPSTKHQIPFANKLADEMRELGLKNIEVDEKGYLMATLPSNTERKVPVIGLISHMDTSPDMKGENINPKLVESYNGEDIILNEESNIILSPKDFPDLKKYIGEDLITTDGTTLLGADDKAGIAEILTTMEYFINNPEIKHGEIRIAFTPDEEVGRGADYFDVEKFGAKYAYTVDGGEIGELEYENFNAAKADIFVSGSNVHPGTAKNKMKNSILIASEFNSMLPAVETPGHTEGYEGFYHLNEISGKVEQTIMKYIIRDHDKEKFIERKEFVNKIAEYLNDKYKDEVIKVEMKDQYYNMKEKIEPVIEVVDFAREAMVRVGVEPIVKPIRGGTDGSRLSYLNLPCPNIFTGGHNFHGKFEFIPINSMKKSIEVIIELIKLYEEKGNK